jgi:methyl-accepting chemotaxis protein
MTSAPPGARRGLAVPLQWQLLGLVVGLVAIAVGALAFLVDRSGETMIREQATRDLESARDRARQSIEAHLQQLRRDVALAAGDPRFAEAVRAFAQAGRQLEDDAALQGDRIRPQMLRLRDHLLAYYAAELESKQLRLESLLVPQRAAVWLQATHVAAAGGDASGAGAAPDVYALAHSAWHPLLRAVAEERGWEDLLLVEVEDGRVVYDTAKTPVFQTGLLDGPYAISALGSLFRDVRAKRADAGVRITDFAPFVPLHGRRTAFAAAPLVHDGRVVGVLAAQVSPRPIEALLASAPRPKSDVEIRLVGADGVTRIGGTAAPRDASSYPPSLLRPDAASTGEYEHGRETMLAATAPVSTGGPVWSLVAEMTEAAALRPLHALRSALLMTSLAAVALAALLGAGVTALAVRPLRRLLDVVRAASRGEIGARTQLRSFDELGDLGRGVDAILDRQERWRAQEAAERARREQEVHELVSVLQAANRGDLSQRARVDGQLVGLANAVNTTCLSIGELTDRLCGVPPRVVETGTTIQSAAEQMLRDAVRHVDEIAAAARLAEQLGRRVRQSADVSASAGERARLVDVASRTLDDAVRAMVAGFARLQKSVGATSGRVKRLGERSMENASLVGSIAKISADLNMLSLNAAIEASRAAQPGGGIGLVADEVRKLAERTDAARDEIARAVEALQGEVNETLAALGRQAEHVERHAEHVAEAESLLASILETTRECAASVEGASRDVAGAVGDEAALQAALADCRDGARRIRTIAEATHGHAQTLLAIAADLPAAPSAAENGNGHAAEGHSNGSANGANEAPRRGGSRA